MTKRSGPTLTGVQRRAAGRPLVAFACPVELLERIDAVSVEHHGGNRSAAIVAALEAFTGPTKAEKPPPGKG